MSVNQNPWLIPLVNPRHLIDYPSTSWLTAQGPHSRILMMGGGGGFPTEVHILYPKKYQLQNLPTQINPYFFKHTQKNPSVFLHQQILLFIFWKIPKKSLVLFSWPKKILASFIDPKKSLLAKMSDPKKSFGSPLPPPPPVIKICEWGPWGWQWWSRKD